MIKKFYVTTPIYYVNDVPHVGHAYTTLAADVLARYYQKKIGKENVFFLTGTDEHGQKVAQAAKEKGISPKGFTDSVAPRFKEAWKLLNIQYDYFIRTTDPKHEKVVSELLQKIYDNGFVYKGTYKGLYCVGCEKFLTETELVNGKCPLHPNKEPVYQEEKNYFLKLKELSKEVLKKIKNGDYQILPEKRRNEVISKIEQGVEDISVSREGVIWGIPIPWDEKQTTYVWVDALWNYYSATQFLENKGGFWPADLHLVGKDILWFHAVIWQALLIAAGVDLPKTIFAHGFFTIDGQKMSKSLGNVITPKQLVDRYGVDGARYLMISAVSFGSDGDISLKDFDTKYNADLANGLGNLVARVAKLCENITIPDNPTVHKLVTEISTTSGKLPTLYSRAIENYKFDEVLKLLWGDTEIVKQYIDDEITKKNIKYIDQYINNKQPWTLKGEERTKVVQVAVDVIRYLSVRLKPFLPETAEKIEKQFKGPKIKSEAPLFPRIK